MVDQFVVDVFGSAFGCFIMPLKCRRGLFQLKLRITISCIQKFALLSKSEDVTTSFVVFLLIITRVLVCLFLNFFMIFYIKLEIRFGIQMLYIA